ncbi:MAG: zinc ribbon domain-containing protein [Methylibium sp.]|uniref:FmdB family zinc ribbon protein n=1 Tax=Methylibium sp. TaxID=2067992 RepID=UPI0017B8D89D|nr:FmdB family zinc ribbon protein [Methylibium sp.]MBA3597658.1 zinc ribbon domain-containing protein [Methylibium sp.]
MPIYAYRCDACGHAKDVLQKVSDPLLSICPACGAEAFKKQLTAAGFQLKGSGWYATDFRNGSQPKPAAGAEAAKTDAAAPAADAPATPAKAPAAEGAASAPAVPPASTAGGTGSSSAAR